MRFENTILEITIKRLVKLVKSVIFVNWAFINFSLNLLFHVQMTKKDLIILEG